MNTKQTGESTIDRIFEAAVNLFAEKGFHGTSMRDLARAVGLKESSLYNHFPGKDAIFDAILEYHIAGLKTAMFSRDEMDNISSSYSDPIKLWVEGTIMFRNRLPPLSDKITVILYNEMFLNKKCRKFVIDSMFATQNKMTEILLKDLYDKGMIKSCDIQKTAAQYVYMMWGLTIETRLLEINGSKPKQIQENFISQVTFFIEGLLKKNK